MSQSVPKQRNHRRGGALVEFAVAFPVLLALTVGAVDFSRMFYDAIMGASAAGVGAFYGARDNIKAGDLGGMESRALADAAAMEGASATAAQYCACPDGTAVTCSDLHLTTCGGGYGTPRAYVRVNVKKQFNTFTKYPFIPDQFDVGQTVWMRVR